MVGEFRAKARVNYSSPCGVSPQTREVSHSTLTREVTLPQHTRLRERRTIQLKNCPKYVVLGVSA